jgi:hypothetical protein
MKRRRLSLPLAAVLLLIAAFLMAVTVPAIGPALRLARGDGRPGTFTAQRLDCVQHPGHESCAWIGEFDSRDGVIHRAGVTLAGSDRGTQDAGRRAEAIDVGLTGRVYGSGGSNDWIFTGLLSMATLALLVLVAASATGAVRQKLASGRKGNEHDRGDHGRQMAGDAYLTGEDK